jgi:pilus assembly protein CpaD
MACQPPTLNLGYGDRVSVDTANGSSAAARNEVAAIAARYGLLLDDVAPVTEGDVVPGTVRVIVSRTTATVPGCPDWSRQSDINFNEHNGSNFGCAGNTNLAAMVANPQDLVLGRGSEGGSDGQISGKAIKAYRDKKPGEQAPGKTESTRANQ